MGLEQEVEESHLQVVVAAAVAEGDLQTHPRVTRHSWKHRAWERALSVKNDIGSNFLCGRQAVWPMRNVATVVYVARHKETLTHASAYPNVSGGVWEVFQLPHPSKPIPSKNHSRPFQNLTVF